MAESRLVPCNLMSWPQIRDLLPDQKLIVYHLWATSPSSAGCWLVDYGNFQGALSITRDALETAFRHFADLGLVSLDETTGEVFINDWFRWHKFSPGPRERLLASDLGKIRSSRLKKIVEKAFKSVASPQREDKGREDKIREGKGAGHAGPVPAGAGTANIETVLQQQGNVKSEKPSSAIGSDAFRRFRDAYPVDRRGSIEKGWAVWQELELDESDDAIDKMIKGLANWVRCDNWKKDGGKFIKGMVNFLIDKQWLAQPAGSSSFNLNDDSKWEGADAFLGMSLGDVIQQSQEKRGEIR